MEFSQVFGFLKILKESIKLLPRNGKFMASIIVLSLLLPSILILLFSYFYQFMNKSMINYIMNSSESDNLVYYYPIILYLVLLFAVEIAAVIFFILISHISGIATVLVSAMSYADKKISSQDLCSRVKTTSRTKLWTRNSFRGSKDRNYLASFAMVLVVLLVFFYHNPVTIFVAIFLGISIFIFQLYSSVVRVMSHVVSIVEVSFEGSEALEKAELLVKGQRHHGFMINLFFNLLFLICFLGVWMILGDKYWSLNPTVYGLVFVNSLSLAKIYVCIAYTVLYFHCKKIHGEEIDGLGNFEYTKLPATNLGTDIP